MTATSIVGIAAAAVAAAGMAIAAAPDAHAAVTSIKSQNAQIIGTAAQLGGKAKECSIQRKATFALDGPFYGSIDHGSVALARSAETKSSTVMVKSKKLPPGWYEVRLVCVTKGEFGGQIIAERTAKVYNK